MGMTNHGNQDMTYEYYEEATAEDFNKRFLEIIPRGIYKGGHLKKVTNSEIILSPFMAEIGDDDEQISVETSQNATLNSGTLDSGNISSATPYIVLRWNFLEQLNNYVEVHAIASVAAALSNDIIVGKCVFDGATLTGFDYTDRTLLNVQNIFLRVEPTEDTEMYVWVRGGRIHTSSQCEVIPEQKVGPFVVPGAPNSRIDLVYIDTDGTVKIEQGSQGVSPSIPNYESKLVIAEVRLVNGDTNIVLDRIKDTRCFIDSPVVPVECWRTVGATIFNASMAAAKTFQDLDLSSWVGDNSALVFLEVKSANQNRFWLGKPKGYGGIYNNHIGSDLGGAHDASGTCSLDFPTAVPNAFGYILCATDSHGVIQHGGDNNSNVFTIKLIGYLK